MSTTATAQSNEERLFLYSTTVCDVGTVRSNNQDSAFAGERLLAICDGMGGHAGGDTASTIAIRSLAHIERDEANADVATVAGMLETSVMAAHDAIVGKAKRERYLAGMGTTLTAVTLAQDYWVIAHIGDSRAYLLREGKLCQMTQDHSYVQHLIDTGRITPSEARNHPQRNVVMRVLGDFDIDPHPDIAIDKAHSSDRWLLCSDGLCGVLEDSTIRETLMAISDQEECAQHLVSMALNAGSTDNVTAVIGDATLALNSQNFDLPHQTPLVGGAAAAGLEPIADIVKEPVASAPVLRYGKSSPAQRAAALKLDDDDTEVIAQPAPRVALPAEEREESDKPTGVQTGEIPVVTKSNGQVSADPNDPDVASAIHEEDLAQRKLMRSRRRRRRFWIVAAPVIFIVVLVAAGFVGYEWSQRQYYVGIDDDSVAIYQGVNTDLFGYQLSHEVEDTDLLVDSLPQYLRDQLQEGITVDSLKDARSRVRLIDRESSEANAPFSGTSEGSDSRSSTDSSDDSSSNESSDSGGTTDSGGDDA